MLRRFSINFALFSMLLDGLTVAFSLWLSAALRPILNALDWVMPIAGDVVIPGRLYIVFSLLWVAVFGAAAIYDGRKYLRVMDEFAMLSLTSLLTSTAAAGVLYLSYREVSRALFILFVMLVYLLCLGWRALARLYFRQQPVTASKARRLVVVGSGTLAQKVRAQIAESGMPNLDFVGFIDDRPDLKTELLGTSQQIREVIRTYQVSDVVIALPHSAYAEMGEIVRNMEDLSVQVWVALGFFDLALYKTEIDNFAGIPMLDLRASAIDDYQRMVKRAFDIVFGSLALVLSLPLIALAALAILIEDGAPVLFRQKRVGENGNIFEMLKLRTMVKNAESLQKQVEKRDEQGNLIHKTSEDPRVTRVGRILRRWSLDELPQFINVVLGSMSLVGPRPELPALVEKYQPWQRKRFAVPPGITGWWQVNGRSDKPMHLNTEDDLYYIQNYSVFLDIQILVKTFWVVLLGKGSY
jgi:exopolysaccharide biosynthesis polyprenyl glycosylphosphotransferase